MMHTLSKPYTISIMSGKGGTGKTLITAMLADILALSANARVLVVDMDIYVRGLTALLYRTIGQDEIASKEDLVVVDLIRKYANAPSTNVGSSKQWSASSFAKHAERSFDILPAVRSLTESLELSSVTLCGIEKSVAFVNELLQIINVAHSSGKDYDYVLLDCRAGYDDLIAATHLLSDLTICVDEDDPISAITATILRDQLTKVSKECYYLIPPGYSKAQFLNENNIPLEKPEPAVDGNGVLSPLGSWKPSKLDAYINLVHIKNKDRSFRPIDYGSIDLRSIVSLPFDADVMNAFGKPHFWHLMVASQYRNALCHLWNALAGKYKFSHIVKIQNFPAHTLNGTLGKLTASQRFRFMLGTITIFFGILFLYLCQDWADMPLPQGVLSSIITILLGIIGIISAVVNFNAFRKLFRRRNK